MVGQAVGNGRLRLENGGWGVLGKRDFIVELKMNAG